MFNIGIVKGIIQGAYVDLALNLLDLPQLRRIPGGKSWSYSDKVADDRLCESVDELEFDSDGGKSQRH
jgi:hypothetical protein